MNTPTDWLIAAGVILPSLLVVLGGWWWNARRGPAGEVDGGELMVDGKAPSRWWPCRDCGAPNYHEAANCCRAGWSCAADSERAECYFDNQPSTPNPSTLPDEP
jgi:hypothetical protein